MTNRLELNWKLDGFVDEQRYYCSETPTDVSSLPAPKAVLPNGARTYTDTTIAAGKAYYIRVGSVRNSTEKISSEFKLYAIKSSSYVFNTSFASNLIDKTGKNWTPIGGAGVENGALNLNNQQKYLTTSKENFSFITTDDDFTIRLKLKVSSISAINVILSFRDYGNYSAIKGFAMYIIDGKLQFEGFKNTDVAAVSLSAPIPNFSTSVRDVSIERKNMIVYLYYDGILIGQATQVGNIYAPLRAGLLPSLGRMSDDSRYYLDGTISDFQIINFAVGDGQPTTPKL